MAENSINAADFDSTLSTLRQGVVQVAVGRAREEVDGWQRKLAATDDPELVPVADNLARLSTELGREPLDGVVISGLMTTLADQTRALASSDVAGTVGDKLEQLGGLLGSEGASLSEAPSPEL